MRTIVGGLGVVQLMSLGTFARSGTTTDFFGSGMLFSSTVLGVLALAWASGSLWMLLAAALFTAFSVGLAVFTVLAHTLGLWGAAAAGFSVMAGLFVLSQAVGSMRAAHEVIPIEVLVLRNKFNLGYTMVRGPTRVASLPWREAFARLPVLAQELAHTVEWVDVAPVGEQGVGRSQRIAAIVVEASFRLNPAAALRIFAAPNWQEYIGAELRRDTQLRGFLSALRDHAIWQSVFKAIVVQQVELVTRRVAYRAQLAPDELSANRDAFCAQVEAELRIALADFGISLDELELLRIVTAEAQAAERARIFELRSTAELRVRTAQIELAVAHIRRNGLPETPEMLETLLLFMNGSTGQLTLLRNHSRELPAPEPEPEPPEHPRERAVGEDRQPPWAA